MPKPENAGKHVVTHCHYFTPLNDTKTNIADLVPKFRGMEFVPKGYSIFPCNYYFSQYEWLKKKVDADWYERVLAVEEARKEERKILRTPVPNPRHNLCHICNNFYKNFKDHIKSEMHKLSVQGDPIYMQIDMVIKDLD